MNKFSIGPKDGKHDQFGAHGENGFTVVGMYDDTQLLFRDNETTMLFVSGEVLPTDENKVNEYDLTSLSEQELGYLEAAGVDVSWYRLDEQTRTDLETWFNREPDEADKTILAKLFNDGKFRAWNCVECGERCYEGQPDDWGHFQGVSQVDYTSYPGNDEKYQPDYLRQMCDHCRMTK
jgi:hypothetical protein